MSNLYNLKSCPFCGSKAYFKTISSVSNASNRGVGYEFKIACNNHDCRVSTPKTYKIGMKLNEVGEINIYCDERIKAVEDWNARYKGEE